jgi:transposase-like protein
MVQAVRNGESLRSVARRFGVGASTVSLWVDRAGNGRLDRVDLSDRPLGARRVHNRSAIRVEARVLRLRKRLKEHSILGEYGAVAIQRCMGDSGAPTVPSVATIGRILKRHGQTDAHWRQRRAPPPKGWYLPAVAQAQAELDSFDFIEDLKIAGGPMVQVLNAASLHGHVADSWAAERFGAREIIPLLIERWSALGRPQYAQFDNDTRFQGAHQFANAVGRVIRLCLALEIIPVFAPPMTHGFQNAIEGFNALWQAKVWQRFRFADLESLQAHSKAYIEAHRARNASRGDCAPARQPLSASFRFDVHQPLRGSLIYLRRCDAHGRLSVLGHRLEVHPSWPHRLVRCEVNFDEQRIRCFALRRREPELQPLLREFEYVHPNKPFQGEL